MCLFLTSLKIIDIKTNGWMLYWFSWVIHWFRSLIVTRCVIPSAWQWHHCHRNSFSIYLGTVNYFTIIRRARFGLIGFNSLWVFVITMNNILGIILVFNVVIFNASFEWDYSLVFGIRPVLFVKYILLHLLNQQIGM